MISLSPFERHGQRLQAAPWRFAKTMPKTPHSYTLRADWDDADFAETVNYIRGHGYPVMFGGRPYIQLDVNEHFYWTMGAPVPETTLINRRRIQRAHAYDAIAWRYDTLFRDHDSLMEERRVVQEITARVGPLNRQVILDVGCGTGMLLHHVMPRRYVGLDPCAFMVEELRHRYPDVVALNTPLASFCPSPMLPRFDLVLALFGVGSYLTDAELARLTHLLTPGGTAVVVFYRAGYVPRTYEASKIGVRHRPWSPSLLPGDTVEDDRYVTVYMTRPS